MPVNTSKAETIMEDVSQLAQDLALQADNGFFYDDDSDEEKKEAIEEVITCLENLEGSAATAIKALRELL